jgi:putative nucleotidyltransferase with HDIG domain
MLGVETVKCLTLSTALFSPEAVPARVVALAERLHEHSLSVAALAAKLVPAAEARAAFAAGMLHDVGRMVIGVELPEFAPDDATVMGRRPVKTASPHEDDATHVHVGSYLLALWGLPLGVVEAVAGHHGDPRWAANSSLAGAVYSAEALLGYVCANRSPTPDDSERLNRLAKVFKNLAPSDIGRALASIG